MEATPNGLEGDDKETVTLVDKPVDRRAAESSVDLRERSHAGSDRDVEASP